MSTDGVAAPVPAPHRTARGRRRFALVVVLLAAAVSVLLYKGLLSSLNYFDTVNQALAHRAQLGTTSFRLEGIVVKNSVVATKTDAERFELSGAHGAEVRVVNTGVPPALFRTDIPVVVVGRFASATSDTFLSDQIMVKHGDSYAPAYTTTTRSPNGSTR